MEGLPGWGISSMPGPPQRQHKHERRTTPSMHPFILTRRIWKDDYDSQMTFGDLVGLNLPDICLTGEEKPRKTSPWKLVPTGDRTRARCVTDAHAAACSTVVDKLKVNTYKTIILPVVLYGCETWSLTLRENKVLKKIFGAKRNEITEEWRKLHDSELHALYSSLNIILLGIWSRDDWD